MKLPGLRSRIEKIDAEIVRLLNERTRLSIAVGKAKRTGKHALFCPEREEALLLLLEKANRKGRGPLPAADLRAVYREIFSRSRAKQGALTVGYLGGAVPPAFLAAWLRFGSGEGYAAYPTEEKLLRAVRDGKVDAAVCPAPASVRAAARDGKLRLFGEVPATGGNIPFYLLCRAEEAEAPAPKPRPKPAPRRTRKSRAPQPQP